MIKKVIGSGLFSPLAMGRDNIEVSDFQFADDTIFVGKASWENIRFIKQFLINLELISGMKVNLDKCNIFGLNTDEAQVTEFASWFGCAVGLIPFYYLGVRVGSSHRKVAD